MSPTPETILTDNGYKAIKLTMSLLEKDDLGLLAMINNGVLHGQRMRLVVKPDAKGDAEFFLIYLDDPAGPTFEYTDEAHVENSKKWRKFLQLLRP